PRRPHPSTEPARALIPKVSAVRLLALLQLPLLLTLSACATSPVPAPVEEDHYRIYRGDGSAATLDALYEASRAAEVTFIGESHNDAVAHRLEELLLRETRQPGLALALEMFETDVQLVLDEYLAGQITEEQFLKDSRPWGNYESAYRPMIEFAREEGLPVLAANAPRRYVNLVGRQGNDALESLSEAARALLPPLPLAQASPAYRDKFMRLMTMDMPSHTTEEVNEEPGVPPASAPPESAEPHLEPAPPTASSLSTALERSLEAQSLWDATMAWSLARHLRENPGARLL